MLAMGNYDLTSGRLASQKWRGFIESKGNTISMSGKANGYDNAMVETFFKTLESELIWRAVFQTRHDAEIAIAR
jgi:putative transposase